jgi:hypothetical protein
MHEDIEQITHHISNYLDQLVYLGVYEPLLAQELLNAYRFVSNDLESGIKIRDFLAHQIAKTTLSQITKHSDTSNNAPSLFSVLKQDLNFSFVIPESDLLTDPIPSSASEAPMFTPCMYNTFVTPDIKIISEEYHFANLIEGVSICSQPDYVSVAPESGISHCAFMHEPTACPKYSYTINVLATAQVAIPNSSSVEDFQLHYSPVMNFFENHFSHRFTIHNIATQDIVSQINLPDAIITFDDAKADAIRIFDEYLAAYQEMNTTFSYLDSSVNVGDLPVVPEQRPFFSTLLSLTS